MQLKLSPKQERWKDFLTEFDMTIEYRSGRLNVVADALRRKAQLTVLEEEDEFPTSGGSQIHVLEELHENIKEGLEHDHTMKNIMKQVKDGKTWKFWLCDGLLYFGE
jgi:hypothetical protein